MRDNMPLHWVSRTGYVLLLVGAVLLSPLSGFLPVEMALPISDWFPPESPHHPYLVRASDCPMPAYVVVALVLIALGLVFIVAAHLLRAGTKGL